MAYCPSQRLPVPMVGAGKPSGRLAGPSRDSTGTDRRRTGGPGLDPRRLDEVTSESVIRGDGPLKPLRLAIADLLTSTR